MNTKSEKLNTLIAQATRHGLTVEIETNSTDYSESYSVNIHMGITQVDNMLDAIRQAESIYIYASRYTADGKPRAFKLTAMKSYGDGKPQTIKPTSIRNWISMMGEDITDYNNTHNQAA